MAVKAVPFGPIVDDTGALVAGATVTIASVKDMSGADIAAHGATINNDGTGLRVSVNYDAEVKGEAWITLLVVKAGSTITGLNANPVAFAAADSSIIGGVTTLLARLTAPRAAYLDALTALTENRMVGLEWLKSALEETSLGSGIYRWSVLALSRIGIDITATRTRAELALPNAAPNTASGLPIKSALDARFDALDTDTETLLLRLTNTRASNLDNLDARVSDMVVSSMRGPLEIYLDGPADMRMAGDVIYVSETPTLILRVLDKAQEPVAVGSEVTARLTRSDTGAAVTEEDIACTVRDATLGLVELGVPSEASDAALAGRRLHLTLAWSAGGRTHVAGAFTLEVKAR